MRRARMQPRFTTAGGWRSHQYQNCLPQMDLYFSLGVAPFFSTLGRGGERDPPQSTWPWHCITSSLGEELTNVSSLESQNPCEKTVRSGHHVPVVSWRWDGGPFWGKGDAGQRCLHNVLYPARKHYLNKCLTQFLAHNSPSVTSYWISRIERGK